MVYPLCLVSKPPSLNAKALTTELWRDVRHSGGKVGGSIWSHYFTAYDLHHSTKFPAKIFFQLLTHRFWYVAML